MARLKSSYQLVVFVVHIDDVPQVTVFLINLFLEGDDVSHQDATERQFARNLLLLLGHFFSKHAFFSVRIVLV